MSDNLPSKTWYSLFEDLCHSVDVCSNCFRSRRGNEIEDFFRGSGGSNSVLRDSFCADDGTGTPECRGTVTRIWDRDPLPARGDENSLVSCLDRMFDRIEERTDVDVDREQAIDAALVRKTDPEWTPPEEDSRPVDVHYFVFALRQALPGTDIDFSR